jgi:hypothetical protein
MALVTEYLWKAGGCLFKEGSEEPEQWVEQQKAALYESRVLYIIEKLEYRLAWIAKRGPDLKNRQQPMLAILDSISITMMLNGTQRGHRPSWQALNQLGFGV